MNAPLLSRRHLILAGLSAAGGLAIGFAFEGIARALPTPAEPWNPESEHGEINAFILIEPDDSIILRIAKSEMGQGVLTSLAMILAEELECDWTKVRSEYASAHRNLVDGGVYGRMGTGGSSSVRGSREFLQRAGASARARLIEAAARRWNLPAASCTASEGRVMHAESGRALNYGALAAEAAQIRLAVEPPIKTPDQYRLMGKPSARLDTAVKVTGEAKFGIDTRLPGMLYAAVVACPVFGGKLKSFDEGSIRGRRGIQAVVPLDNAIAVVADSFWRAKEALQAMSVTWDEGEAAKTDSAQFRALYRQALDAPGATASNDGDVEAAMNAAAKKVEAVYEVPHLAHATMEPLNCTAHWQDDRIDVWIGTQAPDAALRLAAEIGGVKPENVFIHTCFLGGGFGRRSMNDEMLQAIAVSKAVGRPVKLVWTREEDIRQDRYRPQAALRLAAGLGADGMPTALVMKTAVASIMRSRGQNPTGGIEPPAVEGLVNTPYRVANMKVECVLKNTHVPVWVWRSVGSSVNAFAVESFVDEMAHAAGKDPYLFRRALLAGRPDMVKVLDTLAEKSDWGKPLPARCGRGIAIHESFGTIVGEVAEVGVSKSGEVRVERVVAAVDCGHVVNPRTVAMQIESAVVYGLTAALYGEITVKNGRVEQGNFDDYPMMRLADAPLIETHLVLSGGDKWGGIGEPGTPPAAPALTNAIFAATGKRIRSLPVKNAELGGA